MSGSERRSERRADVRRALDEPRVWVTTLVLASACWLVAWLLLDGALAQVVAVAGPPFCLTVVLGREADAVARRRR